MATPKSGRIYKLVNGASGTLLTLSDRDNKTVVGYADYHTLSQEWELVPSGTSGRWKIKSVFKKCYLSVEGEIHNATPVVGTASASEWCIEKVDQESRYIITLYNTDKALDLAGEGSTLNGTDVQVWSTHKGRNQQWAFNEVISHGTIYKLVNVKGGTVLEESSSGSIVATTWKSASSQVWSLEYTKDGYYFKNAGTSKYLAVDPNDSTKAISTTDAYEWLYQRTTGYNHKLFSDTKESLALNLPEASATVSGTAVQINTADTTDNFLWSFQYITSRDIPTGSYWIVNMETGNILGTSGDAGSEVVTSSTEHETWTVQDKKIYSNSVEKYLVAEKSDTDGTTTLKLKDTSYEWDFVDNGKDSIPPVKIILAKNTSLAITTDKDYNVTLYENQAGNKNNWRFEKA